jgi:hypothetical protein
MFLPIPTKRAGICLYRPSVLGFAYTDQACWDLPIPTKRAGICLYRSGVLGLAIPVQACWGLPYSASFSCIILPLGVQLSAAADVIISANQRLPPALSHIRVSDSFDFCVFGEIFVFD